MSLHSLFHPGSLLLIGSSKAKFSKIMVSPEIFRRVYLNLHSFEGHGFLSDIGKSHKYPPSDLTIVSLPPEKVLEIAKELKTRFLLVLSGGFNPEQRRELLEISKGKFRILGPNSVCGLINTENSLNTTFERELQMRPGKISVISQSGGVGAILLDYLVSNKIGISKFAWVGDMIDLNECDLLEYMIGDKNTKVVLLYLESVKEPRRFMKIAKRSEKPILVLKSGVSEQSKKQALTHTGSLSTGSEIYSAAFKQSGVVEVESARDLFNFSLIFERYRERKVEKVAIVSNTGGSSIIASDFCHKLGLNLAKFSEKTRNDIRKKCPELEVMNPLDIKADADGERYKYVLDMVVKDRDVDSVLVINQLKSCLLKPEELEILKRVKTGKVIVNCAPGDEDYRKIRFFLRDTFPIYSSIEDAVKVLKKVSEFGKRF
jgi:acyl-CoA synthetase (NDP forming)